MASRGVNKVILVGRLGSDPEVKYLPSGGAVVNFSLATSDQWKDKNTGDRQERTEWHRVVAFNRLAEIIGEYTRKGSQVYLEGRLQTRKWQGQDGRDNYTTEIVAGELQMLDSRSSGEGGYAGAPMGGGQSQPRGGSGGNQGGQGGGGYGQQSRPQQSAQPQRSNNDNGQPPQAPPPNFDDFEDDIPF